jgi:hypothetical protein
MTGIVIPDGGTIGSASDTDAITISSTGKVTTADSELNVKTTSHTFTVKGIDEVIYEDDGTTVVDADSGQFAVYNGSTKLFGITEHGYVLKPNIPAFKAGLSGTSSSANPIPFNDTTTSGCFNRGGHYNTSTKRFTAPVAGAYLFQSTLLAESLTNGDNVEPKFLVNGTGVANIGRMSYQAGYTGEGGYMSMTSSIIINLNANDYVTMGNSQSYTYHPNPEWTFLCGHLIG